MFGLSAFSCRKRATLSPILFSRFQLEKRPNPRSNSISFSNANLCAGEQAHRYVWFSHGGKTARDRVVELRGYEFVSDLCGSGRHMVQTVVAHRRNSPPCKPGFLQMTSEVTRMVANF